MSVRPPAGAARRGGIVRLSERKSSECIDGADGVDVCQKEEGGGGLEAMLDATTGDGHSEAHPRGGSTRWVSD